VLYRRFITPHAQDDDCTARDTPDALVDQVSPSNGNDTALQPKTKSPEFFRNIRAF